MEGSIISLYTKRFLALKREKVVKVLEIGVLKGASLRMWRDYFPNAIIVGVDINESAVRASSDRIIVEIVDQSDRDSITEMAQRHGPFDLIIEDGSHRWEHQIANIKWLVPSVASGGVYIVEDLQTSYLTAYGAEGSETAISFVKDIIEDVVAGTFRKPTSGSERAHISQNIDMIMAMKHAVAFSFR